MNNLRLALRMLGRDWRAGELNVLVAALVLAVASVGTVTLFADRVKGALTHEANLLLGADVLITGDRPLPSTFAQEAARRGLRTSPAIRFNSMVQRSRAGAADTGSPAVLADVKAVASGYPLRGTIVLADPQQPSGTPVRRIPARGEAWPDTRLAAHLGVKVGDAIALGDATLRVGAIVQQECCHHAEGAFQLDPDDHDIEAVLTRIGFSFLHFLCSLNKASSLRIVIAIADRMPEIGKAFYETGPMVGIRRVQAYLEAQVKAGILDIEDCEIAAAQFLDSCQSTLFKPVLFNFGPPPSEDRIGHVVGMAVRMFLAAYRVK